MHDQRAAAECECCQAEQANTAWTNHCEGQTAALAQQQQQCSEVILDGKWWCECGRAWCSTEWFDQCAAGVFSGPPDGTRAGGEQPLAFLRPHHNPVHNINSVWFSDRIGANVRSADRIRSTGCETAI